MRRTTTIVAFALLIGSCNLDTDLAAPYAPPPTQAGACGTTESLFPKLLAFVRADRFAPLRHVIEKRLLPSADNPAPDPSMRTLLGSLVKLIDGLGLDRTRLVAELVRKGEIEQKISPLLVTLLKFMQGGLDGRSHYDAADAAALFIRRCNPDHLLTAIEEILRFESPSHHEPWLAALAEEAAPLIKEPAFQPFLESFENNSQTGKPAIVSIFVQIMIFVADENFAIDRVNTLMESAVYPVVNPDLRGRLERLIALLDEATMKEAGILIPLQNAVRCGLEYPEARDALIGLIYDLVATRQIGLDTLIDTTMGIVARDSARAELTLVADLVKVAREDLTIRDDLRELVAITLSTPDVAETVPVLVELLETGVVAELLDAVVTLLDGCGRRPSF